MAKLRKYRGYPWPGEKDFAEFWSLEDIIDLPSHWHSSSLFLRVKRQTIYSGYPSSTRRIMACIKDSFSCQDKNAPEIIIFYRLKKL